MKIPPGGLATSGGFFFCDFQATLAATMACDYDFQEMAFDYATLTRSGSPSPTLPKIPALPSCQFRPRSAWYALGNRPLTPPPEPMPPRPRHTAQDGTKSRTWCSLPRLKNGLYKLCKALAIAVLCATYAVTALESPRKPIMQANGK